jgi:toxin FitB
VLILSASQQLHFGVHAARDDETRLARQHRLTLIQATYGPGIAFNR